MLAAFRFLIRLFIKLTGFIPAYVFLKTKTYYSSPLAKKENKRIKGGAIIISNHTSQFDFYSLLFLHPFRVLHTYVGEIVYKLKGLHFLNYVMENIKCNRTDYSFEPINEGVKLLKKNKLVCIFPEGGYELKKGKIQDFKLGVVKLALASNKPIIPIYQKGSYSLFKRNRIVVGERIYLNKFTSMEEPDEKELMRLAKILQSRIKLLQQQEKDYESAHNGSIFNFYYFFLDFIKVISTPLFQLVFFTKYIKAGDKSKISRRIKGKGILISNHVSFNDPLCLLMQHLTRRLRIVMGEDLLNILNPFVRKSTKLARVVTIKRNGKADISGINKINAILNSNGLLALFPEGQVNRETGLLPFMEGVSLFALMNNALIYPRIFVKKSRPFHINHVVLGEPIDLSEMLDLSKPITNETILAANEIIFNKMKQLYNIGEKYR